ncbi:MAG: glutamate--tRNA ligase [Coxiellaceae bacterium]|nr:glutamate--tRNA ligase [Coxiellaceae bacterium]
MSSSDRRTRSRFAPSPTGHLHIGSARTALFAYLYAKHFNGDFILRIEDTDRERSTDESVQAIIDTMNWMGMEYDEGPLYQTQRFDRYAEVLQQLLDQGKAYKCYCSKERIDQLREQQMADKQKPRYDGHCRDLQTPPSDDAPFVVRFKNPTEGTVEFDDQVKGKISVANSELDDLIIARTDGTPTYNFTVVIDDLDMNITEVIRGDDHVNNTPRQINIFKALDATPPHYAHVTTILGEDGKRLSKRHGATNVMEYRDQGILPEALINFVARLGWSHGDQEIFSKQELIDLFDPNHINNSAAQMNTDKLLWLNQHYMKTLPADYVAEALQHQFDLLNLDSNNGPALTDLLAVQAERFKTLKELAEGSRYFYADVNEYDEKAARKQLTTDSSFILQWLHQQFSELTDWAAEPLHDIVKNAGEHFDVKLGKVAQPIRVSMTGNTVSPPIDITLQMLGREKVLHRLQQAINFIESN